MDFAHATWCNRHRWLVKELVMPQILGRIHRELLSGLADRVGGILAERPAAFTEDGVNWAQPYGRQAGLPIIEWHPDQALELALAPFARHRRPRALAG